jgi:hypothetical protein
MKLLSALKRQPADNCIILTYNLDLLFFEHMLFEPLYAAGCRNTLVLCDPLQYQTALADVEQLRYAGQRYLLMPARTSLSGAFHPKLILLTSADNGRLFLTSGNLTKAGYTRNLEIVSLFEYNPKKPDPIAWAAIKWGFDTLSQIVAASDADGLAQQRLEQLVGTTSWLRREAPLPSSAPVWSLHNLDAPLLDQAIDRYRRDDGSPVSEALVISPFFDSEARAIGQLLAQCQPERLYLYTQADTHGLNPRALAAVLERHQPEFHPFQLNLEGRTLHAKALLLRTGQGAWLAAPTLASAPGSIPRRGAIQSLCLCASSQTQLTLTPGSSRPLSTPIRWSWIGRLSLSLLNRRSNPKLSSLCCRLSW